MKSEIKRIKCASVRLASLVRISDRAYKASDFNGNTDIIPASQVFGRDYSVSKSDAYWISLWILEKKSITYSYKKVAWIDSDTGEVLPTYIVEHHTPERHEPVSDNTIQDLRR